MKKLFYTLTATAAASAALALATPVFAAYSGSGQLPAAGNQNGANGSNLPAASAPAPAQSPIVPLGTAGAGILLIGAGGFAIRRRRAAEAL